jgi:hypothetical protein
MREIKERRPKENGRLGSEQCGLRVMAQQKSDNGVLSTRGEKEKIQGPVPENRKWKRGLEKERQTVYNSQKSTKTQHV